MSGIALKWAHSVRVGNQTAKQLLCFLACHNFEGNKTYFKNSTLATILEVSDRAIRQAKSLLIEKGFIEIKTRFNEKGRQTSNSIVLKIDKQFVDKYMQEMEEGGTTFHPREELRSTSPGTTFHLPPKKVSVTVSKIMKKNEKSFSNNKLVNNKLNNKEREGINVSNIKDFPPVIDDRDKEKEKTIPLSRFDNEFFDFKENELNLCKINKIDPILLFEKFKTNCKMKGKTGFTRDDLYMWLIREIEYKNKKKVNHGIQNTV